LLSEDEEVVNLVSINSTNQVLLKVKVAEVLCTELNRFGINLESLLSQGCFIFGIGNGHDFVDQDITSGFNQFTRSQNSDNSIFVNYNNTRSNFNTAIDVLEDDGLISVLVESSLTAISGQSADFLASGEFPVPSVGEDGAVSTEYQPFGVSLAFTPVVLSNNKISLTVSPEVNKLSQVGAVTAAGFSIPSLVTPYIVKPGGSEHDFALPTDDLIPASAFEHILLGKLYTTLDSDSGRTLPSEALDKPRLRGLGFILE
jgi:pilus assembly protein CpaC